MVMKYFFNKFPLICQTILWLRNRKAKQIWLSRKPQNRARFSRVLRSNLKKNTLISFIINQKYKWKAEDIL